MTSLSRRSWLAATALCGAAGCPSWMRRLAAAEPGDSTANAAEMCTLGFSTYGMKTLTTERALRVLADIGYDAVEIIVRSGWDADSAKLGRERRLELRKRIKDSGLQLRSLMEHVFPTSAEEQKVAVKRLHDAAAVGHDLSPDNPPLVQTVLGKGNFEQKKNELRDRLGEWVRLAKSARATFAIKPHRGGVVSKPSEAAWLLDQLGNPKELRMVFDYSHYIYRGLPLEDTVRTSLPHTAHIAVKDAVQDGQRVVFRLPGAAGTIDFATIIRRFHQGGYRGDINCEVSGMVWSKPGYDPVAAAKTCYASLSAAFQQAGVKRT